MTHKITIVISPELLENIEAARHRLELTKSEFVRLALSEKCGVDVPPIKHGWIKGRKRK
jgi:hypothetical protein